VTAVALSELEPLARGLRAPRAAGVAGLCFSALFVVSMLLLRHHPPSGASAAELKHFYVDGNGKYVNLVGLYLAPFAGVAFLWFLAVSRSHIGHRADRFFDTVFLGSGVLFVAMVFAAAAAAGALAAAVKFQNVNAPVAGADNLARALAYSLLFTFAVKAAAVFMAVTSTLGFQTGHLPRWLVYVSWALAVVLLFSVSFYALIILVFPVWVTAISLVILITGEVEGG
jgi:MFS family permease